MRALIIGAGQMGVPIAYAMNKLGFDVTQIDLFLDNLKKAALKFQSINCKQIDLQLDKDFSSVDFDVCISAAPYSANFAWAEWCKQHKVPYCDLGGNKEVSASIRQLSAQVNFEIPVFTDLGLAPGFTNILGERVYKEHGKGVEKIGLRCGGLPAYPHMFSPLQYAVVFSIQGLNNEYSGTCRVLRGGKIEEEKALDGWERLIAESCEYEAFNTSGGLSTSLETMHGRNVQELDYKTIRYSGHCEQVRIMQGSMDSYTFIETIKKYCPPTDKDWVLIQAWAQSEKKLIKKEVENMI